MVWTDFGRTSTGAERRRIRSRRSGPSGASAPASPGGSRWTPGRTATEGVLGDGHAAFGPCRQCGVGFPVTADEAADVIPEDLMEKMRRELDEAAELRAIRSGEGTPSASTPAPARR